MGFFGSGLLQWLLPATCPLCGRGLEVVKDPFCDSCMADILPLPPAHCPRCALPYVDFGGTATHLCSRCLLQPPAYTAAYAVGLYEKQLRQAVQRFKYQQRPGLDRCLAGLLDRVLPAIDDVDLLIPVPLHPTRLRQRTYNQALLLARELGKYRRVAVASDVLAKVRHTEPQQELSARQRQKNLAGAYRLQAEVTGKSILLVDDVMTTGVTVDLCSRALIQGGAAEVRVAVIGRAPL